MYLPCLQKIQPSLQDMTLRGRALNNASYIFLRSNSSISQGMIWCGLALQVPFQDVQNVFQANQAANQVFTGVVNQDPNAIIAGGKITSFPELFNKAAGTNAAQVGRSP